MTIKPNLAGPIFAVLALGLGLTAGLGPRPLAAQTAEGEAAAVVEAPVVADMTLGNPDAPVTVIEYASFTCPHCKNFHDNVFGQLTADYIDTGKIHFIYREVYFDRFGLWAGMVARCGGGERYFGIADLLYEGQREWIGDGEPATVAANLRKIGKTAGIEEEALNACLSDEAMARAMVETYRTNAERDGIDSTPSFVIDGVKYDNMPYDEFSAILDEKLGG